jgi:diadenosine tetraphosphate (Ap4A) HIT family hydrolase
MPAENPFLYSTEAPLVALINGRNGYVQLAPSTEITQYAGLDEALFRAAKAWAEILESHGTERVYWITLSEVVRHLHIHLYPRWPEDTLKGLPLFEARNTGIQPPWTGDLSKALATWAATHGVFVPESVKHEAKVSH